MTKKYSSKVSYVLLTFIFLIFFGPLIPNLVGVEFSGNLITSITFLSLTFVFVLYLFFGTTYTIDKEELIIKCGPFSYQPIEITKIKEISKTNNIISSPAPSFDRIEITYGVFDKIIISPKDKMTFVNDLIKINPSIKNNITE